jgi:outer membrane protein assembly factor BamD (BamD/ComL family)
MRQQVTSPSGASASILIVLAIVAAAVTAIGCAWPGTSHSVRFNAYQSERQMGRLPPLPTMANGVNEARAYWMLEDGSDNEDYYTKIEKRSKEVDALWERAEAAEKDGNLRLDRELLDEYLKVTGGPRVLWFEPTNAQGRRNSASDRLDALKTLDQGSKTATVKAYLDARHLHDSDNPDAAAVDEALEVVQSDRNLKDNALYLKAAEQYRQNNFEEAAMAFKALASRYPRSEKREAALFMGAVATMKTSITYISDSGNADYDYSEKAPEESSSDQAWDDAFAAFRRIITDYPHGKYANDARGWQAYLLLRRHDRAAALAQYYRLLADDHDEKARTEAASSLALVRSRATDDEMSRVEKELAHEPQAALAYAYHNIYNYSIDPGEESAPYEEVKDSSGKENYEATRERNDALEKEWSARRAGTERKELTRTLEFSRRLMSSYPNLSVGGAFALRAAQASEELGDNEAAVTFAQRALQSRLNDAERGQALWTLAVAQHRLRRFMDARLNFQKLLHDYPNTDLTEGARRNLAMIAEDAGDIGAALEQYMALDYSVDVAYFIDVLMTPEQLAAFIQKHPDAPKRNEFAYALGLRYLRARRWEEARKTLAMVQTKAAPGSSIYLMGGNCKRAATTNCVDPKDGDASEEGPPIITPRLVMREVQTANDLEALESVVAQARGDEAIAEAMYQLASYQYEASTLLFYNPIAWRQGYSWNTRYWNLSQLAIEAGYRTSNESQTLFNYMQEHETFARALKIYLEIAERFPRTRAARDALYTAAVCHERLSNYNPYWRGIYQNGLHAGERMVTYADVKATYPNYQLPRGTYGWQPSTRTVNDGPGWARPPKPLPRLTKRERLKLIVNGIKNRLSTFWFENGKRWLTEILIVLGLVFTVRIARRNQRRLRARIARQRIERAKQVISYPWFELFWIDPEMPNRREQTRRLLNEKRQELIALARDRRSRPVLVRSIVSHSAVTGLVLGLLWTIWFG